MVDHVRAAWRVSIRRACRAVPVDRSSYRYRSKRAGQAPLGKRIKERRACAMAIVGSTSSFVAKDGSSLRFKRKQEAGGKAIGRLRWEPSNETF